jgi:hypothetical protein
VREDEEGDVSSYWLILRKREDTDCKFKGKNLLWNRLWTCHKTDYGMNESINQSMSYVTTVIMYVVYLFLNKAMGHESLAAVKSLDSRNGEGMKRINYYA